MLFRTISCLLAVFGFLFYSSFSLFHCQLSGCSVIAQEIATNKHLQLCLKASFFHFQLWDRLSAHRSEWCFFFFPFSSLNHLLYSSVFVRNQWIFFKFCLPSKHIFSSHGTSVFLYLIWNNMSIICLGVTLCVYATPVLLTLESVKQFSYPLSDIPSLHFSKLFFCSSLTLLGVLGVFPHLRLPCRIREVYFFVFNTCTSYSSHCCDQIQEKRQLKVKRACFGSWSEAVTIMNGRPGNAGDSERGGRSLKLHVHVWVGQESEVREWDGSINLKTSLQQSLASKGSTASQKSNSSRDQVFEHMTPRAHSTSPQWQCF